jgi:micrococcal nuclease
MKAEYRYNVILNSVYDGDTINVDINLGFGVWLKNQNIRLYGINAPELRKESREKGLKTKERLIELLSDKKIIIETLKDKKEKYGRWLGKIYVENVLINDVLVSENLAIVYKE